MADVIHRKSVTELTDDELAAFRAAMGKMQAINDNRGYGHLAGYHGVPGFYCWHHLRTRRAQLPANLFLPWHRAYLLYFESALRDNDEAVSLPWWDWSSAEAHSDGVPPAFSLPRVNGKPNPLYSAHISVANSNPPIDRDTTRQPG